MKRIERIRRNVKDRPQDKLDAVFSLLRSINAFYENRLFTIDDSFYVRVNEDVSAAMVLKSHSLIRVSSAKGIYDDRKVIGLYQRFLDLTCVHTVVWPMNRYLRVEQRAILAAVYFPEISPMSVSEVRKWLHISGTKARSIRDSASENMIEILNLDTFNEEGELRSAVLLSLLRRERIMETDKGYPKKTEYQYRVDHPEWRWQRNHE